MQTKTALQSDALGGPFFNNKAKTILADWLMLDQEAD